MSYHIYLTVSMTLKIHYHTIIKYGPFTSSVVMDEWKHRFPRYRLGSDISNRKPNTGGDFKISFQKKKKKKLKEKL